MRGFAAGVAMGLGLGAAALAGLSLVGERETEVASEADLAEAPAEAAPEASVEPVAAAAPEVAPVEAEAVPEEVASESEVPVPAESSPETTREAARVPEATEPETAAPAEDEPVAEAVAVAEPSAAPRPGETAPDLADLALATLPERAPLPEAVPELAATEAAPAAAPAEEVAALPAPAQPEAAPPPPEAAEGDESALPGRVRLGGSALPGRNAVRVNRPGAEASVPDPAPTPATVPALRRYSARFEASEEARPLLSVVLIDDGTTDPREVAALPWPVSVALDPSAPGAAERLAAFRAAGVEALVVARLPEGAQPAEAEAALGDALDSLPETVAVLDLGEGGLGGRDATAEMAMARMARDGRGVVLADQGLRSGLDLAGREGVPAAEVLRDLDGAGQDGAAILRGLDDAVRRAGQEGEAVVLGRVAPGTLGALADWGQEGRAQEVTVAPVSAVLTGP